MCGIWGWVHQGVDDGEAGAAYATMATIERAFRHIDRRGPDARGTRQVASFGHTVTLAHSRLAVLELSKLGAQPMVDDTSGWCLVFNGEIYNYREIRAELRDAGQIIHGDSDTMVLLRAWATWGLDALPRLNGMFAFAAFNERTGTLWLVRDRFGVKPLFWARGPGNELVFGSSVAGIAAQVGAAVDTAWCARGVRYKAYDSAQSGSPFRDVHTVPAGSWIRFQLHPDRLGTSEGAWYALRRGVAAQRALIDQLRQPALAEHCRVLYADAVALRLRSHVPVAVSLSAGLDSAAIACTVARSLAGNPVHAPAAATTDGLRAFSFGSPSAQASEGPGAAALARAAGIDVTWVWPQLSAAQLDALLAQTLAYQEAPFSGLSPLAQHLVFRTVKEAGYKVLLGGQGSDEIFAGYRKFTVIALREALQRRRPISALALLYSLGLMLVHEAGQARMYWRNLNRYRGRSAAFRLLSWESVPANLWGASGMSLRARQIADIEQWSLPTLLRYEDRNSMGYGVESRLPFMDYRLVELALALPTSSKIANGYGKWLLRRMTAGLVPDAIRLNRKKRGFDVAPDWIAQGIGASLRARIHDHGGALQGSLLAGVDRDALLSDAALARDPDLLDEALMLAWLAALTDSTRGG
ncbi:MAG: asparagine synthase (glutamine-hydrolyzing) [Duganella sp.]